MDSLKFMLKQLAVVPALCVGCFAALQTGVNLSLATVLAASAPEPLPPNVPTAAVFSFLGGFLLLLGINAAVDARAGDARVPWRRPASWWHATGGLLGTCIVMASILTTLPLGFEMQMLARMVGVTASSIGMDHLGFMGAKRRPMTTAKVLCGPGVPVSLGTDK